MAIFLTAFNLIGTFVFGISGAIAGIKYKTDIFGVTVLSFAASSAGGIMRDLAIGSIPPSALSDWQNILAGLIPGPVTFYLYPVIKKINHPLLLFDAAGLSLFAVFGTVKALDFHVNPLAAIMLGVLTAVGGGMVRDVLVREIPVVLRTDIYAVAALSGASFVAIWLIFGLALIPGAILGGLLCFTIRIMAIYR
ncbi:MAG: trimeric intracellular cation channel family protein, partial [Thermoplasmataceae archaeon]